MNDLFSDASPDSPISVVRVRRSPKEGAVKAYADVQYHAVTIKGLSIVQHNGGYFVGFPSNVGKNGKRFAIIDCSEPERSQMTKLVLEKAKHLL